ncbi:MAG: antitoxin family protein [Methanosarcinales archaeon]|nr:antitoxin family protein [Methanosarcinales archaeon]MCD4817009.1 antitoxin family protein [Methanosarcinales archaeon]
MTKTIEVVYEDHVFKPLVPVEGLKEHERLVAIFSPHPVKKGLRDLIGTMTHDEAVAMQKLIDDEFEKIEGEW